MTNTRPTSMPHALPLITAMALAVMMALPSCAKRELSEDQAVDLLSKKVNADGLYPASRQGECLSFAVEQRLDERYEIAVREKHGEGCPGDPGTGPVLDRFEVQGDGKLRRYDPIAGTYVDYNAPQPSSPASSGS